MTCSISERRAPSSIARSSCPSASPPRGRRAGEGRLPLKDIEFALIRKAVDDAKGNVMEAARTLGISRATVYRKLGQARHK